MYKVELAPRAHEQLANMGNSTKLIFAKHLAKLEALAPRKFLSGSNIGVEKAGQGMIVCPVGEDEIKVLRIFATHKEYEKWFREGMPM